MYGPFIMQDFLNFVDKTNPQLAQSISTSVPLKMAVTVLGVQRTRSQELESQFQRSGITPSQDERKSTIKNDPISREAATLLMEILIDTQVNKNDFFALLSAYEEFIPLQQPQQNESQGINPESLKKTLEAVQALQTLRQKGASKLEIAQAVLNLHEAHKEL